MGNLALRWLVAAVVTMASVRLVAEKNPRNTLARALLVTAVVACVVTPVMWLWFLIVPALVGVVAWFLVYRLAYGLKTGQAFAVGVVQAALAFLVDLLLVRGRLG